MRVEQLDTIATWIVAATSRAETGRRARKHRLHRAEQTYDTSDMWTWYRGLQAIRSPIMMRQKTQDPLRKKNKGDRRPKSRPHGPLRAPNGERETGGASQCARHAPHGKFSCIAKVFRKKKPDCKAGSIFELCDFLVLCLIRGEGGAEPDEDGSGGRKRAKQKKLRSDYLVWAMRRERKWEKAETPDWVTRGRELPERWPKRDDGWMTIAEKADEASPAGRPNLVPAGRGALFSGYRGFVDDEDRLKGPQRGGGASLGGVGVLYFFWRWVAHHNRVGGQGDPTTQVHFVMRRRAHMGRQICNKNRRLENKKEISTILTMAIADPVESQCNKKKDY